VLQCRIYLANEVALTALTYCPYRHYVTIWLNHHVTMSPSHQVTMSSFRHVAMSPYPYVTMSPCHHVTKSPCRHVAMPPYLYVTMSLNHHVAMSFCHCVAIRYVARSELCINIRFLLMVFLRYGLFSWGASQVKRWDIIPHTMAQTSPVGVRQWVTS